MSAVESVSVPSLVPIGVSIPIADLAALDELAERKGLTRSAVLRVVISQGLEVVLVEEPQLQSRYRSAAQKPIRERRRQRSYAAALGA
jgi:hypothetical protein